MTKTKIALIATAALSAVSAAYAISFLGSEAALMDRFPDIASSDVVKAHRKMFLMALKGEFADIDTENDEVMDSLFLSVVNNL